jgi:hypothetical protein
MQNHLLTVAQFCEAYHWPNQSAMRAYIFRAKEYGLSDAFIRVGRRVLIDPEKFFTLIKQVNANEKPNRTF